ncbi:MAG: tetratricopeptide repeat protein [Sulfuricellaceae bacterium]
MTSVDPTALLLNAALQQAVAHHQAGRWQEAEPIYRAILQVQPAHPDANHNLGVLLGQTGQPASGLPHLKAALEANPSQGDYWLSYADALLASGQAGDALAVVQTAMRHGLNSPAALALRDKAAAAAAPNHPALGGAPAPAEMNRLFALFNAGRHAEMESLARLLVERYPHSGFAWKALSASLQAQGKDALAALRNAAQHLPDDEDTHSNLGNALKNLGQLDSAVASYRRALKINPQFAEAHYNLGVALQALGQRDGALASYAKALEIKPDYAEAHSNLGSALRDLGQLDGAVASYRRALEIKPGFAMAHYNLGNALRDLGQLDGAVTSYTRALEIKPDYAEAHYNLGNALKELGQLDAAAASYAKALEIKPDYAAAHGNLGLVLRGLGQIDKAVASYRRALAIQPDLAEAHSNLGLALKDLGQLDDAATSCRRALALQPDIAEAHSNLGSILLDLGQCTDAVASYRRALEIKPDLAETHSNLGNALKDLGLFDDALASYRHALEIKPDFAEAHGNLLFTLNYHPDKSSEEIFAAYREYDARFGLPLREKWRPHGNDRNANRRLRVGYVSPDFRRHAVAYFAAPLLANHNKSQVEIFCYAEVKREDEYTTRFRQFADHWHDTVGLSDDDMAQTIRDHQIDILIDLAGHTAKNRLAVFARKPAPVSLSWLGFGYTTGLSAVDYLLTDAVAAPAGSEGLFAETPWRLETPGYVYRPAEGMGAVSPLPASTRGYVTFGALTRAIRINRHTIRIWSKILQQVEGARLVIDSSDFRDATMQALLAEKFAAHGIARERLEIGYHSPPWDVLRGLDIGLDCFPHNSGTTLFETLYMGIPFVTLAGRPSVGRLGSSVLEGVGHPALIARTEDDYIKIAVALASNLPELMRLRAGLREEMATGPLMDEAGFARKVETAYREMFKKWAGENYG